MRFLIVSEDDWQKLLALTWEDGVDTGQFIRNLIKEEDHKRHLNASDDGVIRCRCERPGCQETEVFPLKFGY